MAAQAIEARRPHRQDTFDLRNDIITDDAHSHTHTNGNTHASDDDHSGLDDDSSNEEGGENEYMDDDDGSSSLSIPNESIDFDLVYSLHNFAATVEGQASVVKGDSLFLMDDSNSYWWLVRVLTTQEVGYIPAENIETPFERLARLNKHRNVDLASATQEELQEDVQTSRDRIRGVVSPRNGQGGSPNDTAERKTVVFTGASVYNYPPAVWGEEDMDDDAEWAVGEEEYEEGYEEGEEQNGAAAEAGGPDMEPDDGMSWDAGAVAEERARAAAAAVSITAAPTSPVSPVSPPSTGPAPSATVIPNALRPGGGPSSTVSTTPQQPVGLATTLRQQTSRERLQVTEPPVQTNPASSSAPEDSGRSTTPPARTYVDPAAAGGETRKISVTPSIAREAARQSLLQQEAAAKRAREEAEEDVARKKKPKELAQPISSASINGGTSTGDIGKPGSGPAGKLRKGRDSSGPPEEDNPKEKRKKSGVFSGLFGRKKDKGKDKISESTEGVRSSQDSTRSGSNSQYTTSPPETNAPISSGGPTATMRARDARDASTDPRRANAGSTPTPGQTPSSQITSSPPVSQHSLKMQQIDQQQQALYQQYLNRSPATHPEGPSYGLQSASSIMPSSSSNLTPGFRTQGGRPGSLILSPTGLEGQSVPELSVIRVFAGSNLHTEATFKTVLLNASTTSSDLIRQAMQRFRLAAGEDASDFYLEIKQVEGSSAVLLPHERPLGVFESLVEAAQLEVPRVKRSSMGSISSVSSTLSMHPAIKKLGMNDFTDDSAVKFYLNRRTAGDTNASVDDDNNTIRLSVSEEADLPSPGSPPTPTLTVTTASGSSVTPERFSSPSSRFALQVLILPDDLPDGMVFDPHTEAIVPKTTLRDRSQVNAAASSGVSQTQRRKILQFPKNTTVAEVIELALERFGIAEGVVDGGDEVEDKLAKRISLARVRYGLAAQVDGLERQLQPSSKVLDAFMRPPIFKAVDRRSGDKRRSADSAMLLGVGEDVRPDDPIFILRRAVGFRPSGKRMSAPLDEIALQQLHQRDAVHPPSPGASGGTDDGKFSQQQQQMSRQELIAAQRAASRANQRAILSTRSNSERGVDVLLPGNAMLRSSLHETSDKMRYSYVQDGETFDISDIVEEEQRGARMAADANKRDWLEGVVASNKEGLGDNLDRVLNKIKGSKPAGNKNIAAVPLEDQPATSSRAATPLAAAARAASATPTDREKAGSKAERSRRKQPSDESGHHSEGSSNDGSSPSTPATANHHGRSNTPRRGPLVVQKDFGVSDMMAIIELMAASKRPPPPPAMDYVDEMLFGTKINLEDLHPRVREMFESTFKQLDDMDRQLDLALATISRAS